LAKNTKIPILGYMEIVRTEINEKWIDQEGFLRIRVIEGAHIDMRALLHDHSVNLKMTEGKKALALYDARGFFTITPDATDYVRSGILNKERIATAVVTDRLAMRLLVNFMNKFRKPETPLKMFANEDEALKWLRTMKN
jgi:hypothetical protein